MSISNPDTHSHREAEGRQEGPRQSAQPYTPPSPTETPARLLSSEKMRAATKELQGFAVSCGIDSALVSTATPEECFSHYADYLEAQDATLTKLDSLSGQEAVSALRTRMIQMLTAAKAHFETLMGAEKDPDTMRQHEASIARLEAALSEISVGTDSTPTGRDSESTYTSETDTTTTPPLTTEPAAATDTNTNTTSTTPPPAAEANETAPQDLYGSVLSRLKETTPVIEPKLVTPAEAEAALTAATFPEGHKYAGRTNNKQLHEQIGTFIRLNAGKADTGYSVMISDAERDAAGKPKWVVQNGLVVGFQVNEMGTRFQAYKELAPGTETFTIKLKDANEAEELSKKQKEYVQKLRTDFAATGKTLSIAVNRGTNELIVRRMPEVKAPEPVVPASTPTNNAQAAPANRRTNQRRPFRTRARTLNRPRTRAAQATRGAPTAQPAGSGPTQNNYGIQGGPTSQRPQGGPRIQPNYGIPGGPTSPSSSLPPALKPYSPYLDGITSGPVSTKPTKKPPQKPQPAKTATPKPAPAPPKQKPAAQPQKTKTTKPPQRSNGPYGSTPGIYR